MVEPDTTNCRRDVDVIWHPAEPGHEGAKVVRYFSVAGAGLQSLREGPGLTLDRVIDAELSYFTGPENRRVPGDDPVDISIWCNETLAAIVRCFPDGMGTWESLTLGAEGWPGGSTDNGCEPPPTEPDDDDDDDTPAEWEALADAALEVHGWRVREDGLRDDLRSYLEHGEVHEAGHVALHDLILCAERRTEAETCLTDRLQAFPDVTLRIVGRWFWTPGETSGSLPTRATHVVDSRAVLVPVSPKGGAA